MLLSAFACPGAGQFLQKRWLAGFIYATGFIAGFCWFMVLALRIIIDYYRLAFESDFMPDEPNIIGMIPPLAIALVFYLTNLFDVYFAPFRQTRIERAGKLNKEITSLEFKS
jgi:hypothetical protein